MSGLGFQIGDIFLTLYEGFYDTIIPMIQNFVSALFLPLADYITITDPGGFLNAAMSLIINLFWDDITLFEIMIGSGVSMYVVFSIFRYFWGTVEYT